MTRVEAELGRATVRIAQLEEENQRLRDLMRLDIGSTPPEWRLTGREDALVMAIAGAAPCVLANERILAIVWPDAAPCCSIVSSHMVHVRAKLRPFGIKITNMRGRGYVMSPKGVTALREFRARTVDTVIPKT
jgi:DNA-binding response OmpR family regulator